MKPFYFVATGLVFAAVVLLRSPHTQTKAGLTLRDVRPAPHRSKLAVSDPVVYVVGAVVRGGVYHVRDGSRVLDAVAKAGGLTPQADPAGVNLAEVVSDGEEIAVPIRGELTEYKATRRSAHRNALAAHSKRRTKHRKAPPGAPIDINTADAAVLQSLPGVGPGMAQRLIDFREGNGPFHSVDELSDVAGMTDRRIQEMTPYITLH